ncbi:MAG: pseudouridine synthase [Longimicrobiales bacterium]|nr:pseudouridine synthase [Longimicrobiales bacterium]
MGGTDEGTEGVRLQKFLARAGVASRRKAEVLMRAGRVRVNGAPAGELGVRIDPDRDVVEVDGRTVHAPPARWVLLHKPAGVLTTRRDPGGGRTVYDLLPPALHPLRYVGRLDRDTEGLLLMTTDGDLLHRLTHPAFQVEREYHAQVKGAPDSATFMRLTEGVVLEDGPARAVRAWRSSGAGPGEVRLILTEGRKREVRRMLAAVGHPVLRLRRERFGPVRLGSLAPGAWRDLEADEINRLRRTAG